MTDEIAGTTSRGEAVSSKEWFSLSRRFASSPNIPSVLYLAAGAVHELLHADLAAICLIDSAEGPLTGIALDPQGQEISYSFDKNELVRRVLVSGEPLVFN